ncbi:MAG: DNA adenine methylase [Cyanobacteria bacterium P01_A01_bin.37]
MIETKSQSLKTPFPWFGGKSRAASLIWSRFGQVKNYVEPFAGSLGVLLNRPSYDPLRYTETVNDLDAYLANFWRSISVDAESVARYAACPVNEADLQARHNWLIEQMDFKEQMLADPDFCDFKVAGWWVWGLSAWIGSGWCKHSKHISHQLPHLGDDGRGVHRKRPHLGNDGQGVHQDYLVDYFKALQQRLYRVRVCCGDWMRVLGPSPTTKLGVTAILLDPPYQQDLRANLYNEESNVSEKVREWAIENGGNPLLRIALCGYSDEHEMPSDWECCTWSVGGGYDGQRLDKNNNNRAKERIWFSPHCLKPKKREQLNLFLTVREVES